MTDRAQIDAMTAIMQRLENNVDSNASMPSKKSRSDRSNSTGISDHTAQVNEMAAIMQRLENNTKDSAQQIVETTRTDPELRAAMSTKRTETGVSMSRYDIQVEKRTVSEGMVKNFYHVYDRRRDKRVYEDISLFETAMGIVKHELFTGNANKRNRLLELDASYMGCLSEAYSYKRRLSQLDESTAGHDVAQAKYSNVKTRLSTVKQQILKLI